MDLDVWKKIQHKSGSEWIYEQTITEQPRTTLQMERTSQQFISKQRQGKKWIGKEQETHPNEQNVRR